MSFAIWFLVSMLAVVPGRAGETNFGGRDSMNGIKLKDYAGFEDKWKLVTVRYRKDTTELRFTYANEAAWKTLAKGAADYPDGAVFAKIGLMSEPDPVFPSSQIPSGAKRYQFMVRDKKKFAETGGWGYALFQAAGVTYNEDPKAQSVACHACHQIVANRGFVFSERAALSPFAKVAAPTISPSVLVFRDASLDELPAKLRFHLKAVKSIRLLTGPIQKHMFEGTLNEIRPALSLEVMKSGRAAALVSDDKRSFTLVLKDEKSTRCRESEAAQDMIAVLSFAQTDAKNPNRLAEQKQVVTVPFCWK